MDFIVILVELEEGPPCDLGGRQRGQLMSTEPPKAWDLGSKGSRDQLERQKSKFNGKSGAFLGFCLYLSFMYLFNKHL